MISLVDQKNLLLRKIELQTYINSEFGTVVVLKYARALSMKNL